MGNCSAKTEPKDLQQGRRPEKAAAASVVRATELMAGYQVGTSLKNGDVFLVRFTEGAAYEVLRAVAQPDADGKVSISAVQPEEVVLSYTLKDDGDGLMKADAWEAEVQFINIQADKRIMDLVVNDKRIIQLRCSSASPIAVGYPQPFPTTESPVQTPEKVSRVPYYTTEPPKFLEGDSKTTYKQGIYNITDDTGCIAKVRTQADRTIGISLTGSIDLAIVAGFVTARTWLN